MTVIANSKLRPSQIAAIANWQDPAYRAKLAASRRIAIEKKQAGAGFLYVAEVIGTDTVKIGHALDLAVRAKTLQIDHRIQVRMLASIPATLHEEKMLHRALCRYTSKRYASGRPTEFYHRSILAHEAVPAALRRAA